MGNYVFNFEQFLNESALNEGTLLNAKKLGDAAQKEFNEMKMEFLKKQVQLCKKHGVKCFLDFGSLLGLHRDGEMIKNDNDCDMAIFGETVTKEFLEDIEKEFVVVRPNNIQTLINKLFPEGEDADDYHAIPYIGIALKDSNGKVASVKSEGGKNVECGGDFFFYYPYKDGKRITRWPGWEVQLVSDKHFGRLGKISKGGFDYPIPSDPDGYCEYVYGKDWKTPKNRSGHSSELELISRAEGKKFAWSHKEKKAKM